MLGHTERMPVGRTPQRLQEGKPGVKRVWNHSQIGGTLTSVGDWSRIAMSGVELFRMPRPL